MGARTRGYCRARKFPAVFHGRTRTVCTGGLAACVVVAGAAAVAWGRGEFNPAPGSPFTMPAPARLVEFSPNGRLLAVGSEGTHTSAVTLFSVSHTGTLHRLPGSLFSHSTSLSVGSFSPGGKLIIVWSNINQLKPGGQRLTLYSVGANGLGKRHSSAVVADAAWGSGEFSPDGKLLAVPFAGGRKLAMFSVTSGGALHKLPGSPFRFNSANEIAFDPNGRYLATFNLSTGLNNKLELYTVGPRGIGSTPVSSTRAGYTITHVAFSPSGDFIAATNHQIGATGRVWVFRVGTNGALRKTPGAPFATEPNGRPSALAFSPDGKLLAVDNAGHRTLAIVFSVRADGSLRRIAALRSTNASGSSVGPKDLAFSPNSNLLAVANQVGGPVSVFARR